MHLYFYTRRFPPDIKVIESEGTRKAVHGLASGFAACGAEVTILCEGNTDDLFEMPQGYKIQCFERSSKQPDFTIAPGLRQFIRSLDSSSLVILSGIFQPRLYAMSALLKRYSIAYIALPHDPYSPAIFSKNAHLKWPYWHLFERRVLQHATAVQVLDSRHRDYLEQLQIKTPAIAVPNGFSPNDVYPETLFRWNTTDIPKLFFLGRMDAHNKGLDLLLDAFAQILTTTDARLVLQGADKGDRHRLEAQAIALGLSEKTTFRDPDYQTTTPLLIKEHDIFCLPSRFEGFGLSALEAMLAGRVLLISEVAGIAPHVEASGCGVIVAPTVLGITTGLQHLLERRSEWQAMGLAGRRYALEHLQWDKIASRALEYYQQLVQ